MFYLSSIFQFHEYVAIPLHQVAEFYDSYAVMGEVRSHLSLADRSNPSIVAYARLFSVCGHIESVQRLANNFRETRRIFIYNL